MASILKNIARGAMSGYLLKAAQFISSLLMVPFLLDVKRLGLDGYGELYTLLAIYTFLFLFTDGIKLSQSRAIASTIKTDTTGDVIGGGVKVVFLVTIPLAIIIVYFPRVILEFVGLPFEPEMKMCLSLIAIAYLFENSFYSFESCVHAVGRTDLVNLVSGFDVILRNLIIFLYFLYVEANLLSYFSFFAAASIIRQITYFFMAIHLQPNILNGFIRASMRSGWPMLRYSFVVIGNSLSSFLVYRGSIIVVNKFMGADSAGLISLVVGTIRNYLTQILFGVLQPMVVPLASQLDVKNLSSEKKQFLQKGIGAYTVYVFLICFSLVACAPILIPIWLGAKYIIIINAVQFLLVGSALELSSALKSSILIAKGHAKAMTELSLPLAMFCFGGISIAAAKNVSWEIVVLWVAIYCFMSGGIVIEYLFKRLLPELVKKDAKLFLSVAGAALFIFVFVFFVSSINIYIESKLIQLFFVEIVAAVIVLLISNFLIIDIKSIVVFSKNFLTYWRV